MQVYIPNYITVLPLLSSGQAVLIVNEHRTPDRRRSDGAGPTYKMLAWMGGKRSKLKTTRGTANRQTDVYPDKLGKRATTQDSHRPGKRQITSRDAFQQLCAAAHIQSAKSSPPFQTNSTTPVPTIVSGERVASGQANRRQCASHLQQHVEYSSALSPHVNTCLQDEHCFSQPTSAAPDNDVQSDFCSGRLPAAEVASIARQSPISTQRSHKPDESLDLQGIALQV